MVSYMLPSRNEPFLRQTILDLIKNSTGKYEILIHLDGYWPPKEEIVEHENAIYIHSGESIGMRGGIEKCAAIARGNFLIKIDAHCSISKGLDEILERDCPLDGIMIPERRRLDVANWEEQIQPPGKPPISYESLTYPDNPNDWGGPGLNGRIWTEKIYEMADFKIFDIPAFQGSCWGVHKEMYEKIGGMDEENWGMFWGEAQSLVFNVLLRFSGSCKINKKCYYCHWHKGPKKKVDIKTETGEIVNKEIGGRGYNLKESALTKGRNAAMRYFHGEKVHEDQVHPLSYLIDLHPGMPGWTEERIAELKETERKMGWEV